jgi:peptidoglycan hydrolase-like protein with peptidoglycan-binding domain
VIQSLSPGTSISPSQILTFTVNGSNYLPNSFSLSDNFPGTTLTNADINTSGSFYWVPQQSDIGTHVITITGGVGVYGQSATTTQTITVLGTPASTTVETTSVAASSTPLSALQAELAQLRSQITSQSDASGPAPTVSGGTFTASLYSGMQGDAVTELQTVLSQLGFFSATPNGDFGPLTLAAVRKFQAAHDLPQIGVVGPATRAALNAFLTGSAITPSVTTSTTTASYTFQDAIGFGQSGAVVLALQKRLAALGFFSGQPTGYFGDATLQAVIQFQNANGISPVDQLGAATRAALNQ